MTLSDETLQRLVDGELSTAEYQDALLALEADPSTCESNAWRRCALSFLESQAFELGAKSWLEARQRGEASPDVPAEQPLVNPIAKKIPLWMTLLTVAASLVGAFWIGSLANDFWRPGPRLRENFAITTPAPPVPQPVFEQFPPDRSVFVSIPVEGDKSESFDREEWLSGAPTPLSPEVQLQWQRRGFALRASRRIFRKIELPDGRTIDAPIEQHEMIPITGTAQ